MSNLNRIAAMTLSFLSISLGCVANSGVRKNLQAELVEWKEPIPSRSLNSSFPKFRLKFEAPLTAPFNIYSDLRCLNKSKTLKLYEENTIVIPFNAPQGVFFEVLSHWDYFEVEGAEICQIRFIDYEPKKGKNVNESITILKKLCLKPKIVKLAADPDTQTLERREVVFSEVDANECTFDIQLTVGFLTLDKEGTLGQNLGLGQVAL